jgi:hypothetical protein
VEKIKKELKTFNTWDDYLLEYQLEIRFMNAFKLYLKAIRENVIIIYPKKLNPDYFNFPGIMIPYTTYDSLSDIFDKYCSKYFTLSLMIQYRELFY